MPSYNRTILVGRLTRDPQLSYLPNQTPVAELGMAINRRWKGQDGENKEDVCFVDLRAYGKQAEVLNQYLHRGDPLLVEGRLQFSSWEAKDGTKRSKLRVVVESFQFLGQGRQQDEQAPTGPAPPTAAEAFPNQDATSDNPYGFPF